MSFRYLKSVYCEDAFLKEMAAFFEAPPCYVNSDQLPRIWSNLRHLLFSNDIVLFLDITKQYYEEFVDSIYKKRLKAAKKGETLKLSEYERLLSEIDMGQQSGVIRLHFDKPLKEVDFIKASDRRLNAFYLTCESREKCHEVLEHYGVMAICPDTLTDLDITLNDNGAALQKKEEGEWRTILSGKLLPCNSIIITDNYILNNLNTLRDNLGEILDSILPESLDIPFQISIFSTLRNDCLDLPGKERFELIMQLLDSLRPNLTKEFLLFKPDGNPFHDRVLITNTSYVMCGAGFDLFKDGRATNQTSISIMYPFITNRVTWLNRAYSNIVSTARTIAFKSEDYQFDYCPFKLGCGALRLAEVE